MMSNLLTVKCDYPGCRDGRVPTIEYRVTLETHPHGRYYDAMTDCPRCNGQGRIAVSETNPLQLKLPTVS